MSPGHFLAEMRLSGQFTVDEISALIGMFGLAGADRPWPDANVARAIQSIENDEERVTDEQLLTLAVLLRFSPGSYRVCVRLHEQMEATRV
jgi:hypothetical protein